MNTEFSEFIPSKNIIDNMLSQGYKIKIDNTSITKKKLNEFFANSRKLEE